MDLSLNGKTALVCGSTRGIGFAAAQELALLGARCVLLARNIVKLESAVSKLDTNAGQEHRWLEADFSNPDQVERSVRGFLETERVHILVNNTGGPAGGAVLSANPDEFLEAFQQHLICNQLLVQAVIPGMKEAAYGRIVNVISTSVKAPIPNLGVSNTTRWAVASWAKTLAGEVAEYGITVNSVLPGSTLTQRLDAIFEASAKERGVNVETISEEWLRDIPAKRFGTATEIAAMIAFLATPAAAYITGTAIPVDGGRTQSL